MSTTRFSLALLLLLIIGIAPAAAQRGYAFSGSVVEGAMITPDQMAQLSDHQRLSTARSMAMAGAFTSLGGDLSAMAINPAGLAMYSTNEFSLTPLLSLSRTKNSAPDYRSNSASRFALGNIAMTYKLYEGTGRVVSINLGLGYNRIADLNYNTSFQAQSPYNGTTPSPSILRMMAGQLTVNGLYPDADGFLGYYGQKAPDLWGAMMAYNSYLLNVYEDADGPYWEADHIGDNASVGHYYDVRSRGSIGEYSLALAMNMDNKLYVGFTLGVQSFSQEIDLYYGEEYGYGGQPAVNAAGEELIEQADYMHYNQWAELDGVGFNFKFGMIYRPIHALRLGMAVHIPTVYVVEHHYAGQMAAMRYNNDTREELPSDLDTDGSWSDLGGDAWRFSTPTRLMFGLSYIISDRAILSVDYERDWYNGIRTKRTPFWLPETDRYSKARLKEHFKATNNLRVGVEFKPLQRLALRAGFAWSDSPLAGDGGINSAPVATQTLTYTAGIGFRLSPRFTLDAAYQYASSKSAPYRLFSSTYTPDKGPVELLDQSGSFSSDLVRHHAALTLSYRF